MKITFENKMLSSVKLWIEHVLLKDGEAFENVSSNFYPIPSLINGLYSYAAPYQPIVADSSITGATVMTGIYLDNTFIQPGQSGLYDINYEKGQVYFTSQITNSSARLSGDYSVSEFNVKFTNAPEETLLLERRFFPNSKVLDTNKTGINPNEFTYPVIFIKSYGGRVDPFALGGTDKYIDILRLIILGKNEFQVRGVESILKEKIRTFIPLLTGVSEMPFNQLGGYAQSGYNYDSLTEGRVQMENSIWLDDVEISSLYGKSYSEFEKINPNVFIGIADLTLESYRSV